MFLFPAHFPSDGSYLWKSIVNKTFPYDTSYLWKSKNENHISNIKIIYHLIIYRMNCNIDLHNELIDSGEISCPFCDQKLDSDKKMIV